MELLEARLVCKAWFYQLERMKIGRPLIEFVRNRRGRYGLSDVFSEIKGCHVFRRQIFAEADALFLRHCKRVLPFMPWTDKIIPLTAETFHINTDMLGWYCGPFSSVEIYT